MILGPFYFKQKARAALKGNWQTALLVTFFAGIFATVASVLESTFFPDVMSYMSSGRNDELAQTIGQVPQLTWILFTVVNVLSFLLSPALSLGSNHYFLCRLQGEELGFGGLFSRMHTWLRALWLFIVMGVRIFLWGLLLFVPGVLAAIRYSMAPYYMAQDPSLTATEAIEKSKNAMKDMKMSYFSLVISFIGWSLIAMMAQMLLEGVNVVVALVAGQFMQLAVSTYLNAATASFYLTVSNAQGVEDAKQEIVKRMQEMGMDTSRLNHDDVLEDDDEYSGVDGAYDHHDDGDDDGSDTSADAADDTDDAADDTDNDNDDGGDDE